MTFRLFRPRPVTLFLVTALAASSGCDDPAPEVPVEVDLQVAPTPPLQGPARIVVAVRDSVGQPLEGAEVHVEGTAQDFPPVREEASPAEPGFYVIPAFEFGTGGEWRMDTRVRLPDGRETVRESQLFVVGTAGAGGGQ